MTLFELQQWLGHTTPAATQHYAKIAPTKLAKFAKSTGPSSKNRTENPATKPVSGIQGFIRECSSKVRASCNALGTKR